MAIQNFQCARHSLVPSGYLWPAMVGYGKMFQNRSSQMAGKRYFEFDFCKWKSQFNSLSRLIYRTFVQRLSQRGARKRPLRKMTKLVFEKHSNLQLN